MIAAAIAVLVGMLGLRIAIRSTNEVDRDIAQADRRARAACAAILEDEFFAGEGRFTRVEKPSGRCILVFGAEDASLTKLAVATTCSSDDQIALVFSLANDGWRFDRTRSRQIDNAPCEVFIRDDR